jgi:predicted nuclease with TOPRIM domain
VFLCYNFQIYKKNSIKIFKEDTVLDNENEKNLFEERKKLDEEKIKLHSERKRLIEGLVKLQEKEEALLKQEVNLKEKEQIHNEAKRLFYQELYEQEGQDIERVVNSSQKHPKFDY